VNKRINFIGYHQYKAPKFTHIPPVLAAHLFKWF